MLKAVTAILLLASVLVILWFREGYILGTAEDGLIFYNISHYKVEADFAWMEHPGLGRMTLNLTASKPVYDVLSLLQQLGLPGFLIQAGVFWFLLTSGGIGIYLLTKLFFPKLSGWYLILAPLFYWFNPISLVSVWNRFLLNYIFFFAVLPVASFIFVKGLKSKNYFWVLPLTLIFPFYSHTFSYVAFDMLIWIVFFLFTLFYFLTNKDRVAQIFYIKYYLLALILFILANSWWISQLAGVKLLGDFDSAIYGFNTANNLGILDALSKKMGNLVDIFRLSNASFFQDEALPWVKYFYSIPIVLAEFILTSILLYSIIKGKKETSVLILVGILFIGLFLAKGSNPPFGELYRIFFERFSYLQIFRNPFEKFGFLIILAISPLLSFSVYNLNKSLPAKFEKFIYLIFLIYILVIWGFPFYTGLVFTRTEKPSDNYSVGYRVKVPNYYKEADNWLISQGDNFRFIGFPLGDEGITYNWEKGYSGVELSTALFTIPGILHRTAVPYFYQVVPEIEKALLDNRKFYNLANILNAKYFFVREDIDFKTRKMTDPQIVKQNLIAREQSGEIRKVAEFGKLIFWENLKWQDLTFYPANIVRSSPNQQVSDLLSVDVTQGEVLVSEIDDSIDQSVSLPEISYERVNPTKYKVYVKDASAPFMLIFSELFNKGWQASYNEQNQTPKHYRVNHYANGWWIQKLGNYDLTVEFVPQRWFEVGQKVSLFSYTGVLFITWIYLIKRKTL